MPAVDRVPACAVECRAPVLEVGTPENRGTVDLDFLETSSVHLECALYTIEFLKSVHTASSFLSHSLYSQTLSKRKAI